MHLFCLYLQEKCDSFKATCPIIGREILREQQKFDLMIESKIIGNTNDVTEKVWNQLLRKFIVLSCGNFMKVIESTQEEKFVLFSQEQMKILKDDPVHLLSFPLPLGDLANDNYKSKNVILKKYEDYFNAANEKDLSKRHEIIEKLWTEWISMRKRQAGKNPSPHFYTNVFPKEFVAPAGAGKTL